jgi:hypothetical protein
MGERICYVDTTEEVLDCLCERKDESGNERMRARVREIKPCLYNTDRGGILPR